MNKKNMTLEIIVNEQKIGILVIDNKEYISLTDLARYADADEPRYPIQNWMRNKDVISYLGLWEIINNSDFKGVEFDAFKAELIEMKMSQSERLIRLNSMAKRQMELLNSNKSFDNLLYVENNKEIDDK